MNVIWYFYLWNLWYTWRNILDENNLDSLLDELSSMDGELNENIDIDSGVDVDADDMDDISLDELDHFCLLYTSPSPRD